MIKGIVAVASDWGIGKANGLLFDIPADMRHFRETTSKNICVFGYSTYMSLKKRPLPNRINVVLWDKAESLDCLEGCITFNKFDELLTFVKIIATNYDVYICGGASIYQLFLPYYDQILVTRVDAKDKDATAFFPDLTKNNYKLDKAEPYYIDEDTNGYSISKQVWIKK